jgi:hypothetical protein
MEKIKIKYVKTSILCLFFWQSTLSFSQTIWSAGPMLHINIGDQKVKASWGFEVAYWNFSRFPYSFDFCTEFEQKKIRLYSEIQTGIGIAGISLGPVLEIQTDIPAIRAGFQGSIWGNYYLGFDFRYRRIDNKSFYCPGTYLKVAFNGRDENGEKTSGSNSSSFDFDD